MGIETSGTATSDGRNLLSPQPHGLSVKGGGPSSRIVWPLPQYSPKAGHAALFGPLAPAEAQDGPPPNTYAVLDAAKIPDLPELLEASALTYRCLFKGAAFDEFKDAAPWLVQIKDGDRFTRSLFTKGEARWHLWDNAPGIYIRSHAALDSLWRHLRKFTRLRDQGSKWYFFRFWESQLVEPFSDNLPQFPTYQKSFRQIMSDTIPMVVSVTPRTTVSLSTIGSDLPVDKIAIMPDRLELRRLWLHRNMILAADDIFEAGPSWVEQHYVTRRALSFQLRAFIDFCLDHGIGDSDIRSHLMQLIFAHDQPRWPACLDTRPFQRMRADKTKAEAHAMDWIYATQFYLKTGGST